MSDLPADHEAVSAARAVRFGFAAVVLGMSYLNIYQALALHAFAAVYNDMLAGHPLPTITALTLRAQPILIAVSMLIPVAALAAVFFGRLAQSIYLSGALVLAV